MHESKLVGDILSEIERVAQANNASSVEAVRIEIGALSHVTPDGFTGHFAVASHGTIAQGAVVDITKSEDQGAPDALDVRLVSIVTGSA
jgi:hydrogenase nickel incorporation protein HypA/HybF